MKIRNNLNVKSIDSCVPGELFYFNIESARALGILIRNVENNPLLIGVFNMKAKPKAPPFLLVYFNEVQCASFGTDWIFDPQPDENTWPGNQSIEERGGSAHYLDNSIAVRFNRDDNNIRQSPMTHDLKTMQSVRLMPSTYASTMHWRIWASETSPYYAGEQPIFEFRG